MRLALVLPQPQLGDEPGGADGALEQLCAEQRAVGVRGVAIQVVLPLERRGAVGAAEVALRGVARSEVLLQELVLQEAPRAVRAPVPPGAGLVGQQVVAVAAGGESARRLVVAAVAAAAAAAVAATERTDDGRALVGAPMLVQVGLGLEGLPARRAAVGPLVAVSVQQVFLQLGRVRKGPVTRWAGMRRRS